MNERTGLFIGNKHFLRRGKKLFTIAQPKSRPRYWDPTHSKLSTLLHIKADLDLNGIGSILYLGGGHGTTVSHLSDLLPEGRIYVVEFGVTIDGILELADTRKNIFPLMEDASCPAKYAGIIPKGSIDLLYQDIAQRDQIEIFLANLPFLRTGGDLMLMLKTRSISQEVKPALIAAHSLDTLSRDPRLIDLEIIDLKPFQKDHYTILGKRSENMPNNELLN